MFFNLFVKFQGYKWIFFHFQAGETIVLESRIDASWLVGKVGDKSGMFPVEFIQIVRPLDDEVF